MFPSTIEPGTEGTIPARTNLPRLVFFTDGFDSKRSRTSVPAFRMADIVPKRPFVIRVANFSGHPFHVKKTKLLTIDRPADNYLVSQADDSFLIIDHVTAISSNPEPLVDLTPVLLTQGQYLVAPSLPSPITGTKGATPLTMDSAMATNTRPWGERLNIGNGMEQHRSSRTDVLRHYATMWLGRLDHVKDFTCRIDLELGARPIKQHPYQAGPHKREIERDAIADMLRHGVIEPFPIGMGRPSYPRHLRVQEGLVVSLLCRVPSLKWHDHYKQLHHPAHGRVC